MKMPLLRLGAVVGLSIGALALPTTVFAGGGGGGLCAPNASAQVTSCHFSGTVAEAGFESGSASTALTDASLYVFNGRSLGAGAGQPTDQSSIMLFVSKYEPNPDPRLKPIILADIFGYLPEAPGFSIDRSLQTASLSPVTIPVSGYDENGPLPADASITVSAKWIGIGAVNRSSFTFSYRSGSYSTSERFNADVRYAQASVSVVEGNTDLTDGMSQTYADLQSTSDATLTISRS